MKRRVIFIAVGIGVLVLGWIGYVRVYAAPRGKLQKNLGDLESRIEQFENLLREAPLVRKELKTRSAGALAGPTDQVEHELRGRIHDIAERAGLADPVISSGSPVFPANPYSRARRVALSSLRKPLAAQRDFGVIQAELRGLGELAQVLRTLALVQGQDWVQRIESFSIRPRNPEHTVFEIRMAFSVLYVPDFGSPEVPPLAASDDELAPFWNAIASKNVFRFVPPPANPPPVAPPVIVQADPPPVAPPPPYHEWRVTGIADIGSGSNRRVEVTLWNAQASAGLVLSPGGEVLGAKLVEASGEEAVFVLDGERYVVQLGKNLAERRPA